MLNITILGNGGCLNTGLPYNAFLVGENFLVESPPDIMLSMNQLKCDLDPSDTIFISHLHGDHTFGLPFVIINKWIRNYEYGIQSSLEIIGLRSIEGYVKKIINTTLWCLTYCVHIILFTEDGWLFLDSPTQIYIETPNRSCDSFLVNNYTYKPGKKKWDYMKNIFCLR